MRARIESPLRKSFGRSISGDMKTTDYGTVAVFEDLYGNLWDLLEFVPGHPMRIS